MSDCIDKDAAAFAGCDEAVDEAIIRKVRQFQVYASSDYATAYEFPHYVECFFVHADRIQIDDIRVVDSI